MGSSSTPGLQTTDQIRKARGDCVAEAGFCHQYLLEFGWADRQIASSEEHSIK